MVFSSNGQKMEMGIRPHASSMVVRRPDMAPPIVGSVSAPHTPTAPHAPHAPHTPHAPHPAVPAPHMSEPRLGIGARLKAASFSYRTRPACERDRSPRLRNQTEGSVASVANGTPGSFRFRSVTTASFFRSRNRDRKNKEQVDEDAKENGDTNVTTRM